MIRESGKYIQWISFPDADTLRPALGVGYLQTNTPKWIWTHVRQPFLTYIIDLRVGPKNLWDGYAKKLRQQIRRAEKADVQIERDQDPKAVIELFNPIAKEKHLNIISEDTFKLRPGLLITRAQHPEHGILAAHAYQLDPESGNIKGLYNASAFRQFANKPKIQKLCSYANSYLYHSDFEYFYQLGFQTYDFSGYGVASKGANFFKNRFRGQLVTQYNYTPIWYFYLRKLIKRHNGN